MPSLEIHWDESVVKITKNSMREGLSEGHPSIETVGGKEEVGIPTRKMEPEQERIVANRGKEILVKA